jgi:hypothetical protein
VQSYFVALEVKVNVGTFIWFVSVSDIPLPDNTFVPEYASIDVITDTSNIVDLESPRNGDSRELIVPKFSKDTVWITTSVR